MGVPGADDVMLNYQSTSFHDALFVREAFGLRPRAGVRGLARGHDHHRPVGPPAAGAAGSSADCRRVARWERP